MSMMDFFRSSYDLGEQFTETRCQTKDIEEYGISGTLTLYWLDPNGVLWRPEYKGTSDLKILEEGDEDYNEKLQFLNFKWIPNGTHGKFVPHRITKYIRIYPEQWEGEWKDWPTLRLHFVNGVLQSYENITGHKYDYN